MIYFQSRKYETAIDCSFNLYDGNDLASLASFMVGDEVVLLFEITRQMYESVQQLNVHQTSGFVDSASPHNALKRTAHIPFEVVKRSHTCSFCSTKPFSLLTESITLQAQSGYWEDLFIWICLGEVPVWATFPDEEERDRT
jgi:hypothetical protein